MDMIEKKLLAQMQLYPNAETRIFRFCIHPNWIPFYIECYNRMLFVEIIEGDVEEAKQILTDRYEDWVDGGPCEVCDVCCEEYMLEGLNNEKFIFSVGYGEEIQ